MTRPVWLRELLRRPTGAFGVVVILVVAITGIVSLFWTPYDIIATNVDDRWQGPSSSHWLGTDQVGHDTFSWLLAGTQTAWIVMLGSTALATVIGVVLGALGGLGGRYIREPIAVLIDVLIAFPVLLVAMLFAASLGGSLLVVILAVGIGYGVNIARVIRPEIRRVARADYLLAARAAGAGRFMSALRHIVPNVGPVLIVQLSLVAAMSLLVESGLTYLGYGAPAGTPSWGRLLANTQAYISMEPVSVLWPGLTITVAVLGLTLLGDALREALDPRLKRSSTAPMETKGEAA